MCGRYGLTATAENLTDAYAVDEILTEHHPRYNIAPTQEAPVLLEDPRGRRIESFRWGLVPRGAESPSVGGRMINARSETVATRPAFRDAWRDGRRCLVLADGFYEWQQRGPARRERVPYWIRMADGRPFGFAGLWERWGPAHAPLHTFTILTTDPSPLIRPIHDRMPVVLDRERWTRWIDPDAAPAAVTDLLAPYPGADLVAVPVSAHVNDPRHEDPGCIEPIDALGPRTP